MTTKKDKVAKRDDAGTPQEVQDILTELGERATYVTLWKVESGKEQWIDTFPPADWSLEKVRSYGAGGGEYRVRIAAKDLRGENRGQWAKTRTFYIWGGAATVGAVAGAPSSLVEKLLLAIAPAFLLKLLETKPTDPLLLELVKSHGKGGGPDAVAVQQLVESARAPEFEKGRALGRAEAMAEGAGNRDGDADSPLTAAIKEVVPLLGEAMRRNRTPAPARAAARVTQDAAEPEWLTRVRPYVSHMLRWADANKSPEVKAFNILDDLSEGDRDSLAVSCEAESFVQDVFRWLPDLAGSESRRTWFTTFLTTLQNTLAPVEDGDNSTSSTRANDETTERETSAPAVRQDAGTRTPGVAD